MAGGTLAWALGHAGYNVCLLESQKFSANAVPELINERSVVLSYSSRIILEQLELWQDVRHSVVPIHRIHVSEKGRFGITRLHREDEGVEALGYVIRNSVYLKNLYKHLATQDKVTVLPATTLREIIRRPAGVEFGFTGGNTGEAGEAALLIAADGTDSPVRKLLSIGQSRRSYEQAAVIANIVCEQDHAHVAYERFTKSGPLALLPLGPKVMAMVFTVDAGDLENVLAWDDEQMLKAIQNRFGFRMGRIEKIGKRLGFPLNLVQSDEQYVGRILLMGNSARTLHPVSGQGFNLALRDIALLVELLSVNGEPGERDLDILLLDFYRQRRFDQRSVVRFTDALARTFRGQAPGFSHLRSCGLVGLDVVPSLKHLLARHSMGVATRLPNLNRLQAMIRMAESDRQQVPN